MKILNISDDNKEYFQQFYKKHNVVGMLEMANETRVILKMKVGHKGYTPSGCARDCGRYIIIANHSSYDKLIKDTMEIVVDVDDK